MSKQTLNDMSPSSSTATTVRSLSEISETETVHIGVDLVSAARRNIGFLRSVYECHWLHRRATIIEAIRRYEEVWMPLISNLTVEGSTPPMVLPPFDVEWVWFCHTLNPVGYRNYCESRFSKQIGKAAIFNEENEEYAVMSCKQIWVQRYSSEPFENEVESDDSENLPLLRNEELFNEVEKQKLLYTKFSEPYLCELMHLIAARQRYKGFLYMMQRFGDECFRFVPALDILLMLLTHQVEAEELFNEVEKQKLLYTKFSEPYLCELMHLIAARQRYKGFLYMMQRFGDECFRFVPALDILLMLLTHQSYPSVYAEDMKEMWGYMGKVVGLWETVKEEEIEETKKLWERSFEQPYEKAGGGIAMEMDKVTLAKPPIYWEVSDFDVNTAYKCMIPRFLLEVCVFMRLNAPMKATNADTKHNFLRLRMLRCHRELKLDKSIADFSYNSWRKAWHLYCEFGTKGLTVEFRGRGGRCFKGSKLLSSMVFCWNDLLRAPTITLAREIEQVRVAASITPPVQAPYLLKCVPDRVTDDSGAMISDVILKLNNYRPQKGRWLSRTVLDHAGRECFVVRIRVAGGFWRRGAETPRAVNWDERVTEIREGSWSYVAESIGKAPEKVVGTATPKESPDQWQAAWQFSTGDELLINWGSSTSSSGLEFCLKTQQSSDSSVMLLRGRRMQYRNETENKVVEEADDGFVTLVRFTEDNPTGRATALLNWKLLVVELLPEEDAVFVLLLCLSILRTVSDVTKEDVGKLLIRRRLKEAKLGARDWGSVVLHPSSLPSTGINSLYLQPWYLNAYKAMAQHEDEIITRQPAFKYSPAEGGDMLYKRGIIT